MNEVWEGVFEGLDDPRAPNARRHDLHDILVIAFCTMLCGGQTCTDMELFGHAKRELLQTFLKLENGIPSHDTFSRTLGMLDPEGFQQWFVGFMQRFAQGCRGVLALDGKDSAPVLRPGRGALGPALGQRLGGGAAAGAGPIGC